MGGLRGGRKLLRRLPHRLERRLVMQSRDRDAFELMLGAVAELLHRVPADPALGDVAMHVVGKAQVFIDSDAVAGRAGLARWINCQRIFVLFQLLQK